MHGWNGRGSQMGAFASPLVEAGFHVLSYDAPAHGQTPGSSTNIFVMRDVLNGIADQIAPIHAIVAHSFGGMVSALAMSEGLAASRAVLLSAPAQFEMLVQRFGEGLHMPGAIQDDLTRRILQRFGEQRMAQVSPVVSTRQLGHVPALIIHDEDDHDVPVQQGLLIHQNWPGSELVKTSGLGHTRVLYNPGVIDWVVAFVSHS